MERILIFVGLKIAEILGICGIVGILYGIGYFNVRVMGWFDDMELWFELVLVGVLVLAILFLIFMLGTGIYCAIMANWEWASKLSKK